ncbi:MAG TPA: branched-chain amino acid ABC transporter permease [Candidatus Nanopelagicaceae bacterium]|nr:branched-chain amino acid ABC transporter permease [Candidatus Nanopelagicaceae bacterium]
MNFSTLTSQFGALTFDGLVLGAIYALVALGYTLVYGVLRLINFAHSEIFMVGTYGALLSAQAIGLNASSKPRTGLSLVGTLLLVTIVAMIVSGVTAVLIERIAYRRLRKRGAGRLTVLISAIGTSLFLQEAVALWRGRNYETFPRFLKKDVLFTVFGAEIRSDKILILVSAIIMMIALERFVSLTRLGRGIRAVAQNENTSILMGVNIDRVVTLTFLIGGLMAGFAGSLNEVYFEQTRFSIGVVLGIKAFTAAVLGGIGNLRGALLGGLVLGVVESYGAAVFGGSWKDVVAFVILVLVLMFRPSGLLGETMQKARA